MLGAGVGRLAEQMSVVEDNSAQWTDEAIAYLTGCDLTDRVLEITGYQGDAELPVALQIDGDVQLALYMLAIANGCQFGFTDGGPANEFIRNLVRDAEGSFWDAQDYLMMSEIVAYRGR